jgi:hypothetical protein
LGVVMPRRSGPTGNEPISSALRGHHGSALVGVLCIVT